MSFQKIQKYFQQIKEEIFNRRKNNIYLTAKKIYSMDTKLYSLDTG